MNEDALCEWDVDMTCFPDDAITNHPDLVRSSVDTAVAVLWSLTGRQFGLCEVEYLPDASLCRPCRPTLFEGEWYNIDPSAGCMSVYLPGPVFEVLGATDQSGRELPVVKATWGAQVMGSPSVIRYVRGVPLPAGGANAAGRLASQVFFNCTGDKRCRLPQNVRSVTRQGVSADFTPPEDGKTGLQDVDMWVQSVNPHALTSQSEVIL